MEPQTSILSRAALSLSGLSFPGGPATLATDPREQFKWARSLGFDAIVLDCTAPVMRPRNLDRSARRDVVSSLRREDLSCAGIDLFIPSSHLTDPAHQDRAFSAIRDALEFASELAALLAAGTACVAIPAPPISSSVFFSALAQLTDNTAAMLVLIAWPVSDELKAAQESCPKLGVAFDPARVLSQNGDAAKELTRLKPPPASIRLSDFDGISRVPAGSGNLDLFSYSIAASVVAADRQLILDLAGIPDSQIAAQSAVRALSR